MRKSLYLVSMSLIFFLLGTGIHFFWEYTRPTSAASTAFRECVLRVDVLGNWKIFSNATHTYVGCGKAVQSDDNLTIYYSPLSYVSSSSIEENYLLLDNEIMAGGSIGLDHSIITFYNKGEKIKPSDVTGGAIFFRVSGVNR